MLRLSDEEVGKVVLDSREYIDSKWIEPVTILDGDFHPALKYAVHSLITRRKLKQLQAAVAGAPDDERRIAELAKEFCALAAHSPPAGESAYRVVAPALNYEGTVVTTL